MPALAPPPVFNLETGQGLPGYRVPRDSFGNMWYKDPSGTVYVTQREDFVSYMRDVAGNPGPFRRTDVYGNFV